MEDLSSAKRQAIEEAIDLILAERGLGVVETEYGKALGHGLYEFRRRWTAAEVRRKAGRVSDAAAAKSEKILLRVYFWTAGRKALCGLPHTGDVAVSGGRRQAVGTKFSDYLERSRKSDSPDDAALREVFRADIIRGLQFRDARVAMGLTQQELAARTGAPQADISRIERAAANPTESTLLRLADSLNQRLELVAR